MDVNEEGAELKTSPENEAAAEERDDPSQDRVCELSRQGATRHTQKAKKRKVSFPDDECLVSKTVEPVDPWANASNASSAEVVKAYMNSCARLRVKPIDKLIRQMREHAVFHSRIEILDLKGVKLDVKSCETLEEIFKRVQVHTLDIENTSLDDEGAIALMEMIEFYQTAIQIHIGYNPRIKARGWQMFSQLIRKASFLEFVDMKHCCFNDPCTAFMARSLKFNCTLRVLHLEGDNLSGKLLIILCTGLKLNQRLAELFLGDNFLVPSDATTLSAMLKSNSNLQLLDVRNNMLQDQGVMHLCDGLQQQDLGGVKTLVLWNNQITRNGIVPLSNLLAVSKNIQTLNIGHNRLGDDGIRNLQVGLLKNRSLLRLGLLNTKISAEGAIALAEYIADTRTLLRMDLRENELYLGGLMALTLAVKINETVVRIDLDKDLKKEQGMDDTQTSLLVDIYQYLERNRKLGIEREERRRKEREKEAELRELAMKEKENELQADNSVQTTNEQTCESFSNPPVNKSAHEIVENCDGRESGDEGTKSRFTVRKITDQQDENVVINCCTEMQVDKENAAERIDENNGDEKINHVKNELNAKISHRTTNHKMPEGTSKLVHDSVTNEEGVSSPEDFEKELDELLANTSGVKIDLTELPSEDDDEFWNQDSQEILGSSAN